MIKTHHMNSLKIKIRFLATFLLLGMLLSGCKDFFLTEVDNIDLPGTESRLVAYAYISPTDSVVRVHLSRSIPYISNGQDLSPILDRATVHMGRKGGNFQQLHYLESCNCYVTPAASLAIEAGYDYELEVELGDTKLHAICFVPVINLTKAHLQFDEPELITDEYGYSETRFSWQITPPTGTFDSYYTTGAYVKQYGLFQNGSTYDTVYMNNINLYLERGSVYFANTDGRAHRFRASYWGRFDWYFDPDYPGNDYPKATLDSLFIYVLQTDRNYYLFHKSANEQGNVDGNPFAEIVQVYSNIEGGLGVFGGYMRKDFPVGVISEPQ